MVSKYKSEIAVASIILSLVAVIVWQFNSYRSLKDERNLYMSNTHALTIGMEQLRKDSTSQAVQIQSLTLTVDEYRKCSENDLKTIEDLKIKLKNVKAVSKQVYKVEAPVTAPVTHETEMVDTLYVPYQKVEMHNEYIAFDGVIRNDTLKATVNVPITITQVLHKVPKHKFLWWTCGCKGVKQAIVSDNPYVTIKYADYIELR
jgi:hypothetical protein